MMTWKYSHDNIFRLKMDLEKVAAEKAEIQRYYVMVRFPSFQQSIFIITTFITGEIIF